MTRLTPITFAALDLMNMQTRTGRIAVCVTPDGKLDQGARRANRLAKGAIARMIDSDGFAKMKAGQYADAADIFARLDSADAAFAEGLCRIRNREYRPGARAFEKALLRQPDRARMSGVPVAR